MYMSQLNMHVYGQREYKGEYRACSYFVNHITYNTTT